MNGPAAYPMIFTREVSIDIEMDGGGRNLKLRLKPSQVDFSQPLFLAMVTTQPPSTALRVPHTVSLRGKGISDENISTFCQSLPQSTAHLGELSHEYVRKGQGLLEDRTKAFLSLPSLPLYRAVSTHDSGIESAA